MRTRSTWQATVADGTGIGTVLDNDRNGAFTCRASALKLLGSEPAVANPTGAACVDAARTITATQLGTLLLSVRVAGGPRTDQTPDDLSTTAPARTDNATAAADLSSARISALVSRSSSAPSAPALPLAVWPLAAPPRRRTSATRQSPRCESTA
ncbi:MAG TPA: hypothetical protein VGL05_03825 [Kribbella sp.]